MKYGVTLTAACLAAALFSGFPRDLHADVPAVSFAAQSGLAVAEEAARAWDPASYLVYVENDEGPADDGLAPRWGYLFYSPGRNTSRVYSVKNGEIAVAANLGFKLEAPPVPGGWINSDTAVATANKKAAKFIEEQGGVATSVLLMRGAFHEKDPDITTWTVVYAAASGPSLFVVVNALNGDVVRTWRG